MQLDTGWLHHPFATSSFRIGSEDDLAVLRRLGPQRLHWLPELSDMQPSPQIPGGEAAKPEPAPSSGPGGALPERVAAAACQRQFEAVAEELRAVYRVANGDPASAGDRTRALVATLVDAVQSQGGLYIRSVPRTAGDIAVHGANVAVLSLLLGRAFDWPAADLADIGAGALLHDIGKLAEARRHVRARTSQVRQGIEGDDAHVTKGVALVNAMGLSAAAAGVVADHHERADGTGYPRGLRSDRMSAAARLVALVNHFDNLCSPVSGEAGLLPHEAMACLLQGSGRHDRGLLSAFVDAMGIYPAGSVVQLTDGRYALVTRLRRGRREAVRVQLLERLAPGDDPRCLDLVEPAVLGIARGVGLCDLPVDARAALDPDRRPAYFWEPVTPKVDEADRPR
ncbi:HD-GYP domain-containing protein [Methylibium sp.]|uniref:HD-GYP domain-containing protein n=1 Tax=Methylibium sp. TaxID=2067992 RepID=UPI003D0F47E5